MRRRSPYRMPQWSFNPTHPHSSFSPWNSKKMLSFLPDSLKLTDVAETMLILKKLSYSHSSTSFGGFVGGTDFRMYAGWWKTGGGNDSYTFFLDMSISWGMVRRAMQARMCLYCEMGTWANKCWSDPATLSTYDDWNQIVKMFSGDRNTRHWLPDFKLPPCHPWILVRYSDDIQIWDPQWP